MEMIMPDVYTDISNDELVEYTGEFAYTLLIATYTVVNFAILNPEFFSAAWDFFDNSTALLSHLRSKYFGNGRYKMTAQWVPGSSGSIYPPNSWQGASGYYKYVYTPY